MPQRPGARSMAYLRKQGYAVGNTEHWNPHAGPINKKTGKPTGIRQDLYRVIDMVAIRADLPGVLAVQATSRGNLFARVKKSLAEPNLLIWLKAHNRFQVHGWKRLANGRWSVEVKRIVFKSGELKIADDL